MVALLVGLGVCTTVVAAGVLVWRRVRRIEGVVGAVVIEFGEGWCGWTADVTLSGPAGPPSKTANVPSGTFIRTRCFNPGTPSCTPPTYTWRDSRSRVHQIQ
jgi:hypothetical protein